LSHDGADEGGSDECVLHVDGWKWFKMKLVDE
jgi:hypothetical protein